MKLSAKEWIIFIVIALVCLGAWYTLSYSRLSVFDYTIDKKQALAKAHSELSGRGIDTSDYLVSIIFWQDYWADRYLQKTLGFSGQEKFLKEHDYELFSWAIRFFKEGEKEEYVVSISPRSGEVVYFSHLIEDTEARETKEKEQAKQFAQSFLQETYAIDFSGYDFHEEKALRKENRIDYRFSWEKKGVYIPWEDGTDAGGAKLIVGAMVSGDEIKEYFKNRLDVPEKFERFVQGQKILGGFIATIFNLVLYLWIVCSVFIIIRRRNDIVIHRSWKWMIAIGSFLFLLSMTSFFNDIQALLFYYITSSSLASYIGISLIRLFVSYIFVSVYVMMPGAAAEALRQETYPKKKFGSFFHYINSTLFSRSVANSIALGYVLAVIFLGVQAVLFTLGQRYVGVWVERIRISDISTAAIPFLAAFIIGCRASFSEEIIYRMFGVHWTKKYFKRTLLAILIPAIVWGFSHTEYPIFPVWFRGVEVTILGVLYGVIFLRYGIIPLLVSHYLFDVFWGVAGFIFGNTSVSLFSSSIFILSLPLLFAVIAFVMNKRVEDKKVEAILNPTQRYNVTILMHYIQESKRKGVSAGAVREELIAHHWDRLLVDVAIERVFGKQGI
ncbi:type II CAAX prenyl endopeptidase Rce1 family protein [Candidatus Omnitrophota bacterium]